jgi:uncharacterized protein
MKGMKAFFAKLAHKPAPLRIGWFVLILGLLWAPFALPVQLLVPRVLDQNWAALLTMPWLYLLFIAWAVLWGRWVHGQPNQLKNYGMRQRKRLLYEWLGGLGIGYGVVLLLYELQGAIGWTRWVNPVLAPPTLLLTGLVVATVVAVVEELFFRGWLLDELTRDYKPDLALGVTSVIYALLHCLRIVPASLQLIALAFLGLALGLAKRSTHGRLGLSIGLHSGLVWGYYVLNVGRFFQYTGRAPEWLTGFERNPLAGLLGILTMGLLLWGLSITAKRPETI